MHCRRNGISSIALEKDESIEEDNDRTKKICDELSIDRGAGIGIEIEKIMT